MPVPVELLRFFDRAAKPAALARPRAEETRDTDSPKAIPAKAVLTIPAALPNGATVGT
jgi:hypothetical protein